jgi:transcriptional regulator with XRE-family HTH domain
MATEKIRYPTPALEALRAATDGMTQAKIAERLGCSQAMVSEYLGGRSRPGTLGRMLAERHFGVPIAAWFLPDELPSDDANDASQREALQAARTSSIPPCSDATHAAASEGCPAPSEAA